MEYFVTGNLNHNGTEYKRGDSIDLSDEGTIQSLLEAGVIQTEPVSDEVAEVPAAEPQQAPAAEVAGQAMETGEPSIDGPENQARGEDNAEDITPVVDAQEPQESVREAEQPKQAPRAKPARRTPSKGRKRALSQDTKDERDPSAGL